MTKIASHDEALSNVNTYSSPSDLRITDIRITTGPDGVRREYFPNLYEQAMREIALSYAGTNIPLEDDKPVEDGGSPIIKVGVAVETVEATLRDIQKAANALTKLAKTIERNPNSLLLGR